MLTTKNVTPGDIAHILSLWEKSFGSDAVGRFREITKEVATRLQKDEPIEAYQLGSHYSHHTKIRFFVSRDTGQVLAGCDLLDMSKESKSRGEAHQKAANFWHEVANLS